MTKISELPAGTTVDGTEKIAAVQGGVTVELTLSQAVSSLAGSVTIESAGGGIGKTSAQNTAAINSLTATQGTRIIFGPGTYNYLPPINITKDFVTFQGAGYGVTNLKANPTADGVCINIAAASPPGDINNITFKDMSLSSTDTTFKKTMVKATAQSGLTFNNVLIGLNFAGGTLTGGTGGSIGLYVLGHQFLRADNFNIYADNPIIFGKNPYSYISTDHYSFRDLYLIGGTTQPLIRYEPGVTIYDNVFDTVAFVKGTDGIYTDPALCYNHVQAVVNAGSGYVVGEIITLAGGTFTTAAQVTVLTVSGGTVTSAAISRVGVYTVLPSNPVAQASTTGSGTGATFTLSIAGAVSPSLHVVNGRFEQGASATSYSLNLASQSGSPLNTVVLDSLGLDGGRKGIYGRYIAVLSVKDVTYTGALEAFNVDATVDPICFDNVKFATGATTSISGLNTIYASGSPTGYAYPPFTVLSALMSSISFPTFVTLGTATLAGSIAGSGGSGNQLNNVIIGTSSPRAGAFTTLTATTVNKVTINAPATSATINMSEGKALTINNSLQLAGTDGTTMTFPTTSATVARTDAAQTFTGIQTFAAGSNTTPGVTVGTAGYGIYQPAANQLGVAVNTLLLFDYGISAAGKFTYGSPIVALNSILSTFSGGGIGYAIGAGNSATQATSKSTTVAFNAVCGAITMNNAALAAATIVSFTFTNTAIAATDVLILNHISGGTPGSYTLNARAGAGSATIDVRNNTAGSLSEAIVIQFAVIKAVNA